MKSIKENIIHKIFFINNELFQSSKLQTLVSGTVVGADDIWPESAPGPRTFVAAPKSGGSTTLLKRKLEQTLKKYIKS